jgi:hypothetical protein
MEPRIVSPKSLGEPTGERNWNWVPLAIAAALVGVVVVAGLTLSGRSKHSESYDSVSATLDPYAPYLKITNLAMSESSNLAGGKVTYIDGHIANLGSRTVTEVVVQVIFRNYAREVAQTQRMPLTLVRMREPYIDTEMVSAAPLKPSAQQDFRLNFDTVSPDWSGATPEVSILHVTTK